MMKIRRLIVKSFLITAAISIGMTSSVRGDTPNIVLIYADDLGYGDVGCFNPESRVPTPVAFARD